MSAYLVVDIIVINPELFREYAQQSQPFVEKHGGAYLVRGGDVEIQEGAWNPERLVVVEFPTKENAKAFLTDPGYRPVAALRHEAAVSNMVIVDGYQVAS